MNWDGDTHGDYSIGVDEVPSVETLQLLPLSPANLQHSPLRFTAAVSMCTSFLVGACCAFPQPSRRDTL